MFIEKNKKGAVTRTVSFVHDKRTVDHLQEVESFIPDVPKPCKSRSEDRVNFFVGLKPNKVGTSEIRVCNGVLQLVENGKVWMTTGFRDIKDLGNQVVSPKGRVCVAGLGLGLVAVLLSYKEEVHNIDVYEVNKDIIDLFECFPYDKTKIRVHHKCISNATGIYDYLCLDHYNLDSPSVDLFNNIKCKHELRYGDFLDNDDYNEELSDLLSVHTQYIKNKVFAELLEPLLVNAKNLVFSQLPDLISEDITITPYSAIFSVDSGDCIAVQVAWEYEKETYSVKVANGKITDLYHITLRDGVFSVELDVSTRAVVATYPYRGHDKYDTEGNLLQKNIPTNGYRGIPTQAFNKLLGFGFPFFDDVTYYAEKPYGNVVEITLGEYSWI